MIALIEKGLSRQKAYELVQRNAMKAWKGNKSFLTLLKADPEATGTILPEELEILFDYQHYLQYVDDIFQRLGLTKSQWQGSISESNELRPRTI
jgi:adenylosuccinate lyase